MSRLLYNKTNWKDDETTPINARNLNNLEDGIEYVYEKWDEIISDATTGDHAAELIDARKNKKTLGERLDGIDTQFNTVMQNINNKADYVNPKMFGAVGDGITDDTQAIQSAINYCKNNNINNLYFDNSKVYKISQIINIDFSNINIYFNSSEIHWHGIDNLGVNNGISRLYGVFNFKGREVGNEVIVTSAIKNINSNNSKTTKLNTNIDVNIGEYVNVKIKNMSWGTWSKTFEDECIIISQIFKVVGKGEGYIEIDYNSPFDLNNCVGGVVKIKPLENINIYDFKFKDCIFTSYKDVVPNNIRENWVGGLFFEYCINSSINNCNFTDFKFPAIMLRKSANLKINNCYAKNPQNIGAGCGYGIQVNYSNNIHVENYRGSNLRHLVDFSGSIFSSATNCNDLTLSLTGSYDCHGICEHDINFYNCKGSLFVGNGIDEFPMITENLSVDNCNFNSVRLGSCKNFKANNSELGLFFSRGSFYINNMTLNNCIIKSNFSRTYLEGKIRNLKDYSLQVKISNSSIIALNEEGVSELSNLGTFRNINNLIINNTSILNENINRYTIASLEIDANSIELNGCTVKDTSLINSTSKSYVTLLNNKFILNSSSESMYVLNFNNSDLNNSILIINNNIFKGLNENSLFWLRSAKTTPFTNGILMFNNNILTNVRENSRSDIFNNMIKSVSNNLLINYIGTLISQ